MVFDIETVKATVKIYADEVRQVMPISKVYLYGSYAKGTANEYSDVDVFSYIYI
jgi:predicted nucleotidyltransferase